jgi:hypothetical protein
MAFTHGQLHKASSGIVSKILRKIVDMRLKTAQRRLNSSVKKASGAPDDEKLAKRVARETTDVDVLERMAQPLEAAQLCDFLLATREDILGIAIAPPPSASGHRVADTHDVVRDGIIDQAVAALPTVASPSEQHATRLRALARALLNHEALRITLHNPNKRPPPPKRRPGKRERAEAGQKAAGGGGDSAKKPRRAPRSAPFRPGSEEGKAAALKATTLRAEKQMTRAERRALRKAKFHGGESGDAPAATPGAATAMGEKTKKKAGEKVDAGNDIKAAEAVIAAKLDGRAAKRALRAAKFRSTETKKGVTKIETGSMFVMGLDGGRADGGGGSGSKVVRRKATPKAKKFAGATDNEFFAGGGGAAARIPGQHPSWVAKRAKAAAIAKMPKGKKKTFDD